MSITVREQPGIPEEHLRACFQKQYDLIPITLEFLPVGHDYNAGVYRVGERADPFFQGYGQTEIDWVALTYYRWERVVQDVIEYAQSACFRDDWAEETRADIARLFHEYLAEGGNNIAATYAAAAHLPRDLTVHTRDVS